MGPKHRSSPLPRAKQRSNSLEQLEDEARLVAVLAELTRHVSLLVRDDKALRSTALTTYLDAVDLLEERGIDWQSAKPY